MNDHTVLTIFIVVLVLCIGSVFALTRYTVEEEVYRMKEFDNLNFPDLFNNIKGDIGKWKTIIIHHTAASRGSFSGIDQYHREVKRWGGMAYHLLIGNGNGSGDGEIEAGFRWWSQLPGTSTPKTQVNNESIAICLVGDFEKDSPSTAQMMTLDQLIDDCCKVFHIDRSEILMHREVSLTKCPGKNFPINAFRPAK